MILRVHPLEEFWIDFGYISGLTKMAITSSKMDEFLIFQILLLGIKWDNPQKLKKKYFSHCMACLKVRFHQKITQKKGYFAIKSPFT